MLPLSGTAVGSLDDLCDKEHLLSNLQAATFSGRSYLAKVIYAYCVQVGLLHYAAYDKCSKNI